MDETGTPPAAPPPTAPTPALPAEPAATPAAASSTPTAPGTPGSPAPTSNPSAPPAAAAKEPKDPGARKGIARFDKLWEPVRRFWSGKDAGDSVAPAGTVTRTKHRQPRVLFICTGNATRSPMAEAFAAAEGLYAESAGTFPKQSIPQEAVEAMREKGFELGEVRPKLLDPTRLGAFDRVVTFGTSLPPQYLEGARVEDWEVWDPAGLPLEGYRLVANELEKRVARLAKVLHGKQAAKDAAAKKANARPRAPA